MLPPNPREIAAIMAKVHNAQAGAPNNIPFESSQVGPGGGPLPVLQAAAKRTISPRQRLGHILAVSQGKKSPVPALPVSARPNPFGGR